jgi:hypothetical protein
MATKVDDFSTLISASETPANPHAGDGSLLPANPKSIGDLRVFQMSQGGLDRLNFATWDTIEVAGMGEDTVEFHGYYVIERENPTTSDWRTASVDIHMRELNVNGVSQKFGRIHASTNPEFHESGGQVKPGTVYAFGDSPKLCAMLGFMKFDLLDAGISVFNKDAIVLTHNITHIPPVGQGGGTGPVAVELFRTDDPDGPPVAILRQVKTHIGSWLE